MLAGITEADEHWPERIEQALTFRTEAIFTSRFTAAGNIERVTGNMHAQADLPRFFVFFHQAIVGMTELSGELFIMTESTYFLKLINSSAGSSVQSSEI